MRKYLSLTKALLKCGIGVTDGASKKGFKLFLYGILCLSCLPIAGVLYFLVASTLEAYMQIGQEASILGTMMFLVCIIIFIFSIFMIPSIFYFSTDTNTLLALPLKPEHIIGSRFTVCLLYEIMFSLAILVPTYAAYGVVQGVSASLLIVGSLTIVLLPIFPLVLSTILTILMMRFVPFFKNRDRFNMIAGILSLILAFGFSFASNSFGSGMDETELLQLLLAGNNSMLDLFMNAFPMIPFFARAVLEGSMLDFLIGSGITLLSIIVFLTLGKFLYFKGAIGNSESMSSHKEMDEKQLGKATKAGNKIWTYAKKEFKILLRTPVFCLNCLSSCFIFPLVLVIFPLIGGNSTDMNFDLSQLIPMLESLEAFPAYLMMAGLGLGCMLGIINMISATSISREGTQYTLMKILPMSYRDQIHAKTITGTLAGLLTVVLTVFPMMFLFPLSPFYYLIFFLCACISTIMSNQLVIIVDLAKPKLVWEQEVAAVKQNLGSFVSVMIGMAICVIFIGLCFIIPSDIAWIVSSICVILSTIGCWGFYQLAGSYAEKAMRKL